MSRYIDAEVLKAEMRKAFPSLYDRVEINTIVNLQPTIDIVRCKECKHSPKNTKEIPLHDSCYTFGADDFCSYGEREGE